MPTRQAGDAIMRQIAVGFGALMVLSLLVMSVVAGRFANGSADGDDVMRLVQIQDFLAGQGWFDVSQARLGPDGGTAMHWSRLVDVPILALTAVLDIVLPADAALYWACALWPPLSVLLLVWGLVMGARHLGGRTVLVFTCIIAGAILFRHQKFLSFSIDHHNVQLAFLAIALGASLDPARRPASLALAGAALAISTAIGVEVYAFVGVFCAFHALDWAVTGAPARRGVAAFGASFGLSTLALFFLTIGPAHYGTVHCDALSLVTVSAAALGGFGLALAAWTLSGRAMAVRGAGLAGLGLACGVLLLLQAPQCLANPLSDLPPIVQTLWLDSVDEARPIYAAVPNMAQEVPFRAGIMLVALGVSAWQVRRGVNRRGHLLIAALLLIDIALMIQQVRFYTFGHIFAILPLGAWVAGLYSQKGVDGARGAGYILALAVSVPLVWGAPGMVFKPAPSQALPSAVASKACAGPASIAALNAVPVGLVLTVADAGPGILEHTDQRVLHGHYHRNVAGIETALEIFTAPPADAVQRMRAAGIAYVLACPMHPEMEMLAGAHPEGLAAHMQDTAVPEGLDVLAVPAEGVTLYRVQPPST
ncbi:hypothetical protein [Hyphomonas johnsonii]|uniref:Uncharacterized protein n=1 Tax=Hyphomonas johnsonii MHS-2 TaxID=1280950 RepID=A0A059FLX0_9PROT|nr:hypothetical protein [Hyphomonas johnsonii]KCZ91592.1 hypothetical protein HJO_10762 [Hyphomonas johnsonii MHS-2]